MTSIKSSFFLEYNEYNMCGLKYLFYDLAVARTFLEFANSHLDYLVIIAWTVKKCQNISSENKGILVL